MDRPPPSIGLKLSLWVVRRMYKVEVYLRVRRAVMVEGMSIREAAREFGLHRDTVRKMLAYSTPPGYRRQTPPRRPKLERSSTIKDAGLFDAAGAGHGDRLRPAGPSWSSTPASSTRSWKRITASPRSSGTPRSASSSGCGTSTGLAVDTPRSRTTSGSIAAGRGRCSCPCPTPRAMPSATSVRP